MIPEVHLREHIHFAVAIRDRGLFIRFHYSYLIRVRHPLHGHQVTPAFPAAHIQILGKLRGVLTYISLFMIFSGDVTYYKLIAHAIHSFDNEHQ